MEGGLRRIRFLLSPQNPIDAEILTWLDSLPKTARGTEMKAHLTAALIEYIRRTHSPVQRAAFSSNAAPASVDSRRESARPEPRPLTQNDATRTPPSGALARHLLKDFG
jgi:hypothetical protein